VKHGSDRFVDKHKNHQDFVEEEFTFANTVDYRAAGVKQRWRINDGFSTDGTSVRVQQFLGDAATVQQLRCNKRDVAHQAAKV